PRRLDLLPELPGQRDQLVQQLAVDASARRLAATRQREVERDVAALEALCDGGAGRRLQGLEPRRQPAAPVQVTAVDAFHLPGPVQTGTQIGGVEAFGAREAGHAGDGQGDLRSPFAARNLVVALVRATIYSVADTNKRPHERPAQHPDHRWQ